MSHLLPTVVLLHTSRAGSHYDWLLANPRDPRGLLWTARCEHPTSHWAWLRRFDLTPIQPHRRAYLKYQGPLTAGRGQVTRVDEGVFTPLLWTEHRMVIELTFRRCAGRIEMQRLSPKCWRAMLTEPAELGAEPSEGAGRSA